MNVKKLTLLTAILSTFALAACDKADDTTAAVEAPASEATTLGTELSETVDAAIESVTETTDALVESATETTDALVESAIETATEASDKIKELTGSAIETTKQATEEAKEKAEKAVENVRQSFSTETGVTNATVDPSAPIEAEVSPLTSGAAAVQEDTDLVGQAINDADKSAEQALEEVKEAGVEVREAIETDLEDAVTPQ